MAERGSLLMKTAWHLQSKSIPLHSGHLFVILEVVVLAYCCPELIQGVLIKGICTSLEQFGDSTKLKKEVAIDLGKVMFLLGKPSTASREVRILGQWEREMVRGVTYVMPTKAKCDKASNGSLECVGYIAFSPPDKPNTDLGESSNRTELITERYAPHNDDNEALAQGPQGLRQRWKVTSTKGRTIYIGRGTELLYDFPAQGK
eukprot:Gb_16118 [translate_table: standard]